MTQMPLFNTVGAIHLPPGPEILLGGTMTNATCAPQTTTLQTCGGEKLPGHQSMEQRLAGLALLVIPVGDQDWMTWT